MAGVNWVPIRPDYADVTRQDYLVRLRAYRELGFSVLRIWGGAAREADEFYELCDEMGFLLWQELPLSSSGLDNLPPSDAEFAAQLAEIAEAYVGALAHHPSIFLWGGGNELASNAADNSGSIPAVRDQSPLAEAGAVFAREDPGRRFVPSSPSGPRALAFPDDFGKGLHHDVHGPWMHNGTDEEWRRYWDADDAVLRSEVGFDGASRYDLLSAHDLVGPTATAEDRSRLADRWTHSAAWLLQSFRRWSGRGTLREWVAADQQRQADLLGYAAASARRRFPRCAGFIVWMGHDAYPMPTSLSLIDFDGVIKPAAWSVSKALSDEG
jgi:beta-mannosidase